MLSDESDLKQLPILAVDDEEANLLLVRRVLERAGYCSLTTTSDPLQVPRIVEEIAPRLALLDLHMPGVDGFELMEMLNEFGGSGDGVPILVLTADITDDAKRRALSLGARDFLTKPIDHVELTLRVRNVLHVQQLQERLLAQNLNLEDEVAARTQDLDRARLEVLDRLALWPLERDDRRRARPAARSGAQDRTRGAVARHRQGGDLRRDPAEARTTEHRGVRVRQAAYDDRRRDPRRQQQRAAADG